MRIHVHVRPAASAVPRIVLVALDYVAASRADLLCDVALGLAHVARLDRADVLEALYRGTHRAAFGASVSAATLPGLPAQLAAYVRLRYALPFPAADGRLVAHALVELGGDAIQPAAAASALEWLGDSRTASRLLAARDARAVRDILAAMPAHAPQDRAWERRLLSAAATVGIR